MHDSRALSEFAGVDGVDVLAPDESTMAKFRHLLGRHGLGERVFALMNEYLARRGIAVRCAETLVDATIVSALVSKKNAAGKRDPEMSFTCKGGRYYFGMKAHVGVSGASGVIHAVDVRTAHSA